MQLAKFYEKIWQKKQEITNNLLSSIGKNEKLISYLSLLKNENIKIVCCSNSIRNTVKKVLENLGIADFFDAVYSNEDVTNPKPHPEMYWAPMIKFSIKPNETVIIEDSPIN